MDRRAEISKLVAGLAEYYDKALTSTQLAAYTEDLLDLDLDQLARAIKLYRNDPRHDRFPLPVKLKAMVGQTVNPDDEAVLVAGRIVGAISKFGHYHDAIERARAYIGEIGWQVVQCEGGWEALCTGIDSMDEIPIRKAQWRNLAKSFLESPRQRSQGLTQVAQSGVKLNLPHFPKEGGR